MLRSFAILAVGILGAGAFLVQAFAQEGSTPTLPKRAIVIGLAHDVAPPTPTPTAPAYPPPPPPDPAYCEPSGFGPPTPPNAVIGLFSIGGEPAPAGTLITLTFDGKRGPAAYIPEAGGYRVFYAAGGQGHEPPCINQVGSELGVMVNGQAVQSGVRVGDEASRLVFRFDVALP